MSTKTMRVAGRSWSRPQRLRAATGLLKAAATLAARSDMQCAAAELQRASKLISLAPIAVLRGDAEWFDDMLALACVPARAHIAARRRCFNGATSA